MSANEDHGNTPAAWTTVTLLIVASVVMGVAMIIPNVPLFFGGLGNGLFIAPNAQFIVATVDRTEAGAASGVIATMQRIGAAARRVVPRGDGTPADEVRH